MATRDIFALPGELSRAILASVEAEDGAEANGRNAVLNRMALAGRSWHNALAPQAGACMPALTRRVLLKERDMLAVAQIARPWWRWVQGSGVTDTGLASLAAGCPDIVTLDLIDRSVMQGGVTDTGLASLAAGCTAITTLNLWGCFRVTDTGLASLAAGCTGITTLNLFHCYQITDAGLASLAAGCTAITTLDLDGCDGITDTGLASLAAGCSAMTSLNLTGCDLITDTGLEILAAGCPNILVHASNL